MMMDFILVNLVIAFFVLMWAAFTAFGGLILMWAWNLFVPLIWHAAPMLNFWQGVAGVILIQFLTNLLKFGGSK